MRAVRITILIIVAAIVVSSSANVLAVSISEGYLSGRTLPRGTLASLKQDDPNSVEAANVNNSDRLLGVVTSKDNGLLALSFKDSNVQIAVSGETDAFVTTLNGNIVVGDMIMPSHISGVGQLAETETAGRIVGVALEGFDDNHSSAQVESIGGENVVIGAIPIRLVLDEASTVDKADDSSLLIKVGEAIAGRPVTTLQVILAASLFLIAIFLSSILLFGAIRGSFTSLGRNPLAANSVFSSLLHVTVIAIIVMLAGLVAAYLILLL